MNKISDPEVDQPWKYPLQVGNEWNYERDYYVINPDTQYKSFIGHDSVEVKVTHIDSVTTQVITHVMHSRYFGNYAVLDGYYWYASKKSGLFEYANIANGASVMTQ